MSQLIYLISILKAVAFLLSTHALFAQIEYQDTTSFASIWFNATLIPSELSVFSGSAGLGYHALIGKNKQFVISPRFGISPRYYYADCSFGENKQYALYGGIFLYKLFSSRLSIIGIETIEHAPKIMTDTFKRTFGLFAGVFVHNQQGRAIRVQVNIPFEGKWLLAIEFQGKLGKN